ncbi:hypothetical protein [Aeromonas hydrophila]|uniref:hypothetical protein n=1 Tax=Aeromonas hydrophila TaxID=644 RepID=UPI002B48240E|nr:hypothetical protein [Aeromonas hydrophila]
MQKKEVDWEAIEGAYRAGLLSLREMSQEYGVSHVAIKKRADKEGWTRDLTAKIKAKADALVNSREVNGEVNSRQLVNESEIVNANAEVIANIRLSHRKDISRSRNVVMKLLGELEESTDNIELFENLGELMRREDDKGQDKLNDLYHKVISMAGRTKTMKDLADSLKTMVALERQAYGLDTEVKTPDSEPGKEANINDVARRLAFILTKSLKENQNG